MRCLTCSLPPQRIFSVFFIFCLTIVISLLAANASGQQKKHNRNIFYRQNIVAWCIVSFDSANRGPVERSAMLKQLGITKLAYDWREKHVPTFDQELDALNKNGIHLQAFWMLSGSDPANDKGVHDVLSFLKRRKVKTQIWYMYIPPADFNSLSQAQKVDAASATVAYIAKKADSIGCTVGLYNHDGWFGEPENQLAIINRLKMDNIGIVYNFNHAQDQIDRFPEFYPKILPHLIALNLAGLKKGDQNIYPIGKGDSEQTMIGIVRNSSFRGPIGIINEVTHPDAETGLKMNMEGLKQILLSIGDEKASQTYNNVSTIYEVE